MPFCSKCGTRHGDDDNFCSNCGNKVKASAAPSNQTPEPPYVAPEQSNAASEQSSGIRIISKSDPLFRVKCEYCCCEFEYRVKDLGYRAWYPSGFVYCPSCKKPIRHKLEYEVK